MQYRSILDIDMVANADTINVATQYSIEPHATMVPHYNVANDAGPLGKETLLANLGGNPTYRDDMRCHRGLELLGLLAKPSRLFRGK